MTSYGLDEWFWAMFEQTWNLTWFHFWTRRANLVEIQSSRFRWFSFVFERTQSRLVINYVKCIINNLSTSVVCDCWSVLAILSCLCFMTSYMYMTTLNWLKGWTWTAIVLNISDIMCSWSCDEKWLTTFTMPTKPYEGAIASSRSLDLRSTDTMTHIQGGI